MKKIILAIVLVICISSTLTACGGRKGQDTSSQTSSQTTKIQKPANHDENALPTVQELEKAKV